MFGRLFRLAAALMLGWFVFLFGALAYAALRGPKGEPQEPDADEVDLVATFGPLDYTSTATAFRGGSITTWFGGGQVDLREARMDPSGADLRVNALFGGGNLIVPSDWRVESRVLGIGGVGDSRQDGNPPEGAPTLRFHGSVIFGGWAITSEPARDEVVPV